MRVGALSGVAGLVAVPGLALPGGALAQTNFLKTAGNYAAGDSPASVAVADFNGDNHRDLAVVNQRSDNVSVLLGGGDGNFGAATNYRPSAGGFGNDSFSYTVSDGNGGWNVGTVSITVKQPGAW